MDRDDTAKVLGLAADKVRIVPTARDRRRLRLEARRLATTADRAGGAEDRTPGGARLHPQRIDDVDHQASILGDEGDHRRRCRRPCPGMIFVPAISTPALMPAGARPWPTGCLCTRPAPMRRPTTRAEGRAIHTHGPISGAFRGFGVPQATIMQETLYDELASKLGMDRLDFRLKNCLRNGLRNGYRAAFGLRCRHRRMPRIPAAALGAARTPMHIHSILLI